MTIPVFVVNSHEAKFDKLIASIEKLMGVIAANGGNAPGGGMSDLEKTIAAGVAAEAARRAANALLDGVAQPAVAPVAPNGNGNGNNNGPAAPGDPDVPPAPPPPNPYVPPPFYNPYIPNPNFGPDGRPLPFVPPPGPVPQAPQPEPLPISPPSSPGSSPEGSPNEASGTHTTVVPTKIEKPWSQLSQKERNAAVATVKVPLGWGMMTNQQQQKWRKQQYLKVQRAAIAKEKKDNETAAQELAKVNADILAANIKRAKDALPPIKQLTPPADWATLTIKQKDEWRAKAYADFKQKDAARMKQILAGINAPAPDQPVTPTTTGGQVPPPFNAPVSWASMSTEEQKQWVADNNSVVPKADIAPAKAELANDDKVAYVNTPQGMADTNCSVAGNYVTNFEHNLRKPMAFYSAFAATDLNLVGSLAVITPNSHAAKERAALLNLPMAEQLKMASLTTPMPSYTYVCSLENAYSCGYNATQSNLIAVAADAGATLPQFAGNSNVPTLPEDVTATSDLRSKMYDDSFAPSDHDAYVSQQNATAQERTNAKGISPVTVSPPSQTDTDDPEPTVIKTDVTDPTSIPSNAGN